MAHCKFYECHCVKERYFTVTHVPNKIVQDKMDIYKERTAFTVKIIAQDIVLIVKRASIHKASIHRAVPFIVFPSGINVGTYFEGPSMVSHLPLGTRIVDTWRKRTLVTEYT
jgi:hypothetical protein